jgi:hypothetical protein
MRHHRITLPTKLAVIGAAANAWEGGLESGSLLIGDTHLG